MQKICTVCKKSKSLSEFHKHRSNKDRLKTYCRPCDHAKKQIYKLANWNKIIKIEKNSHLIRTYGITLSEFQDKLKRQNNKCAICKNPETALYRGKLRSLSVDHRHSNLKVRDLLCASCNHMIGLAKENKEILKSAIDYLTKHNN